MAWAVCDAGGSATKWAVVHETIHRFQSIALHPAIASMETIAQQFQKNIVPILKNYSLSHLFFYGAGFEKKQKAQQLQTIIQDCFPKTKIEIHHDLLGAARACLQNQKGIIAILGTGSIAGFYNGNQIIERLGGWGYLINDEGSGADIGKRTLQYLCRTPNPKIMNAFERYFQCPWHTFIENLYQSKQPNRYLAQIAPWLQQQPQLTFIIEESLSDFCRYYLVPLCNRYAFTSVHFVGGIAYHFRAILKKVLQKFHLTLGAVLRDSLQGLIRYHQWTNPVS